MSVLIESTKITISNKSPFFLGLTLTAHQNASFKLLHNPNPNIMPVKAGDSSSWLYYFMSYFTGEHLEKIVVKAPKGENLNIEIVLNSALNITYEIEDTNTTNVENGTFEITEDILGDKKVHLIFKDIQGVGYKENGDVAINADEPTKRDVSVKPILKADGLSDQQIRGLKEAKCLLKLY